MGLVNEVSDVANVADVAETASSGFLSFLGGIKIYLIIGVIIAMIVGAAIWYFKWSQDQMKQQAAAIGQLQTTIVTQTDTLNQIKDGLKLSNELLNAYAQKLNAATEATEKMRQEFKSYKIQETSITDPLKAQTDINKAIDERLSRIEAITSGQYNSNTDPSSSMNAVTPANNAIK